MRSFKKRMLLIAVATLAFTFTRTLPALQGESAREKVIIDSDMGQLNDDATVLFMLAKSDHVDVLGLTIVAGNTWVEAGTAYGLRNLEILGRTDIPVVMGGKNYGRSMGYHESRRRSFASPENFPAGTQKVKVLFDIDRDAFWDLYVGLMTKQ